MTEQEIKTLIEQGIEGAKVDVTGDGHHFEAVIIAESFKGMMPVKRQQAVYACFGDKITSGELHALSMKTFAPDEAHG